MSSIGIRELARHASKVVDEVQRTGKPALVTRHGRPAAVIVPVSSGELEDFILATDPEFVESRRQADEELKAGKTRSLASVLHELGWDARDRRCQSASGCSTLVAHARW
jgi:prevent-host-death family protein